MKYNHAESVPWVLTCSINILPPYQPQICGIKVNCKQAVLVVIIKTGEPGKK